MSKILLIADLHLGHHNIIKYCDRPFNSVEEMNETIINNWNSVVKDTDEVLLLGDFCFGGRGSGNTEYYLNQLKGNIHLIKGNHDRLSHSRYEELFNSYYRTTTTLLVTEEGGVELSHKPIVSELIFDQYGLHKGGYEVVSNDHYKNINLNIHGHTHNTHIISKPEFLTKHFCVSVEAIDYKPILLNEIK